MRAHYGSFRPPFAVRALLALALHSAPGWADPVGDGAKASFPVAEEAVPVDREPVPLEQAKEQFRRGVELLNQGSVEPALEAFQRSRALVASRQNTTNAAICLERLGRYDEALELYEDLLARFANDLPDDDRRALGPVIESLRARVGYLEVRANENGLVSVDGRGRGRLPLAGALRVLPGEHQLSVLKEGFLPLRRNVSIEAGKTLAVDVTLVPEPRVASDAPVTPRDVPAERAPAQPNWGLPVLIAGGATLVAGGVTWLVSGLRLDDARDRLAEHCVTLEGDECVESTGPHRDAAQAASDDALTFKRVRAIGIGVTALGAVTAAVGLYGLMTSGKGARSGAQASVRASREAIEVEWRTRF